MQPDQRKCKKCGELKAIAEFPVYDIVSGARRHECKPCNVARIEKWHSEHKPERLEQLREAYHERKYDPEWYDNRMALKRIWAKSANSKGRREALEVYGLKCACCGIEQQRFLTIDHIASDGYLRRKEHGSGYSFYRWLKKNGYPAGFQTLCFNCNTGRALNGGICPHKQRLEGSSTIPDGGVGPSGPKRAGPG